MKYFKIIGNTPEEDAYVSSEYDDDTPERIVESFNLGLAVVMEISEEAFLEAKAEHMFADPDEDKDDE